jgi:hypothetical protein
MTTREWPFPGDDKLTRYHRVAVAYRVALQDAAPDKCAEIDEAMRAYGQYWVVGGRLMIQYQDDDLVTVAEIADQQDTTEDVVRHWVHRWPLQRMGRDDRGRALYRWGDVLAHERSKRKRRI